MSIDEQPMIEIDERVYSSNLFSYSRDDTTFSAFMSDLPGVLGKTFLIRSERTGVLMRFEYDAMQRDSEGDVQVWFFRAEANHSWKVKIFND